MVDKAVSEAIRDHGTVTSLGKGGAVPILYSLATGGGALFAASNGASQALSMTVNCAGSQNMITSEPNSALQSTATLPPRSNAPGVKPAATYLMALTNKRPGDVRAAIQPTQLSVARPQREVFYVATSHGTGRLWMLLLSRAMLAF